MVDFGDDAGEIEWVAVRGGRRTGTSDFHFDISWYLT